MAKSILYKAHCVPQEQVGANDKYYLDGDCGKKLTGSNLYELVSDTTTTGTLTASGELGADNGFDFIAVQVKSLDSGNVTLSLDNGTTQIIKLLEGECFASKITPTAQPYVTITGGATVEYMTGT